MALLDAIINEIPKNISQRIFDAYPDEEKRNALGDAVILSALTEMVEEQKRQKFLQILANIEPWEAKPDMPSVVETLRKIRQQP